MIIDCNEKEVWKFLLTHCYWDHVMSTVVLLCEMYMTSPEFPFAWVQGKKPFLMLFIVCYYFYSHYALWHTWTKIWALSLGPDTHSCVISRLLATALQCYLAAISYGKILSSPGLQWKFSPDEIFLSPAPRSNLFMTRYLCHPK